MNILITGANGNLAQLISNELQKLEYNIYEASSKPIRTQRLFDLHEPFYEKLLADVEVVIHCARGFKTVHLKNDKIFVKTCSELGVQIIYVGSISSWLESLNKYGEYKKNMEEEVLSKNGTVITCGLIYGKDYMGQVHKLNKLLKKLPFYLNLPETKEIFLTPTYSLIHEINTQINHSQKGYRILLAHKDSISFNSLLQKLGGTKFLTLKLNKKFIFFIINFFGQKIHYFNTDALQSIYRSYRADFKNYFIDKSNDCGALVFKECGLY